MNSFILVYQALQQVVLVQPTPQPQQTPHQAVLVQQLWRVTIIQQHQHPDLQV